MASSTQTIINQWVQAIYPGAEAPVVTYEDSGSIFLTGSTEEIRTAASEMISKKILDQQRVAIESAMGPRAFKEKK